MKVGFGTCYLLMLCYHMWNVLPVWPSCFCVRSVQPSAVFHRHRLCSLQEAYFRYMAENPTAGLTLEEEEDNIDYDSDGNPIPSTTKKIILPLPPIDHSEVL